MALSDIRHRTGYLFLVVAVGHIILISAQVNTRPGVPLLEDVFVGGFAIVQRVVAAVFGGVAEVWSGYVALRGVREENEVLRDRVAALEVRMQEIEALAEQSARLRALLDLRDRSDLVTTAAEVTGGSPSPDSGMLMIDKGSRDGLTEDMAVLAPGGVVGRVSKSGPAGAQVQLLVERNAAVAALVAGSRAEGIVVGTGGALLRLEFMTSAAVVREGDEVLTSGMDRIYPKGFVIGRVEQIERMGTGFQSILVRPAVDFWALEEVLVVRQPVSRLPEDEGSE